MSALKKAGLIPKKVDVRKAPQSKHYESLLKKFSGVVKGTHSVAPAPANAKAYNRARQGAAGTTVAGNKVIIPKSNRTNKTGEYKGWPARVYKSNQGKVVEIPLPQPWDDLLDNPLIQDMETWADYALWDFIVKYERDGQVKYYMGLDVGELLDAKLLNSGSVAIIDIYARRVFKSAKRKP